ncbi:AraC family transcriptional regulator [Pedobacter cryoconitis]|uniref:AraC-like DNA-binding protein n=1 Tax=Pedobacter cryoconitis TaxID=188932 RepID=A0A7X0J1E0_9SPHI|nr:AraC family transcriptional regulator [Pedobacter cryoconitis]MBB6499296.1 AraC-like DNA-binding protein [Pedobacter cryoconitis]
MDFSHEAFSLEIAEYNEWQERSRINNFFELVYVIKGNGIQSVNYIPYEFKENDVHILPATKCYKYVITKSTRFLFIRFTGNYFTPSSRDMIDYSSWFSRLNFILGNHHHHPGELVQDYQDKQQIKRLVEVVLCEYQMKDICSAFVIQSTLVSILGIISRNIQKKILEGRKFTDNKFADLLSFISFNILDQTKITTAYLSDKFNISETYFSEYFKRNAAEGFQEYVLKSKLKIAESRAIYTHTQMKEIAWELGFTDSSHLNKMMKKHYGRGMKEIRNNIHPDK